MTITEQKRQIAIMQGQVLDSDLTEEEKEIKLRALTNEFNRLKRRSEKSKKSKDNTDIHISDKVSMSVRLTDVDTGKEYFFNTKANAALFVGMSPSKFYKQGTKKDIVAGYKVEQRDRKYRYQRKDICVEGTIHEIAKQIDVSENYLYTVRSKPEGNVKLVEIDRWEGE